MLQELNILFTELRILKISIKLLSTGKLTYVNTLLMHRCRFACWFTIYFRFTKLGHYKRNTLWNLNWRQIITPSVEPIFKFCLRLSEACIENEQSSNSPLIEFIFRIYPEYLSFRVYNSETLWQRVHCQKVYCDRYKTFFELRLLQDLFHLSCRQENIGRFELSVRVAKIGF